MFSLNVSGMGCGSCVSKITKAIQTLDQDARVEVDRAAGKVTVERGARRIRKKSYAKPRHVLARERSQEDGSSYFRKARQSTTS